MIKFLTYIATYVIIFGVIIYDYLTDTFTLGFICHPSIAMSFTCVLIAGLYIYSFAIDKKTISLRLTYLFIIIVDCGLSIFGVYLMNNNSGELRQLNDPLLSEWKQERSQLADKQNELDIRYNKLLFGEKSYPGGAQRDGEHKMKLQLRIDDLNSQISSRETHLAGVGGKLNESLLSSVGNQTIVTIFLAVIGLIPPLCLPIAGMAYKKLGRLKWLSLPVDIVNAFGQQLCQRILGRLSTKNVDMIDGASTLVDSQIQTVIVIHYTKENYPSLTLSMVGQHAADIIGRDRPYDKGLVSRIIRNDPKYWNYVNANPIEANKALNYVKEKDRNKTN